MDQRKNNFAFNFDHLLLIFVKITLYFLKEIRQEIEIFVILQTTEDALTTTHSESIQDTQNNCDPSYPDVCIPSPPPDLDCKDVPYGKFKVLPPDPHRFDGDKNGIGCESN